MPAETVLALQNVSLPIIADSLYAHICRFHAAMLVAVEHRFYGTSIPQNWNSTKGLGLLTMQQAVTDLAVFRDKFQKQVISRHGYNENAWIVIGCGYAGALATWARSKYPRQFSGAWASSPPLQPVVDFPSHDIHDRSMLGEQCAKKIEMLSEALGDEARNEDQNHLQRLKSIFRTHQDLDHTDFRLMIHDSISLAIQHGFKGQMCQVLNRAINHDDVVRRFANLTEYLWGSSFTSHCHFNTACLSSTQEGLSSARSWHWQQCTQIGLFATTPKGEEELGLRHKMMDSSFFMRRCVAAFGKGTRTDPRGIRFANQGPGDRVIVVTARDDPWRHVIRVEGFEPDEVIDIDCEGCGRCFDILQLAGKEPVQLMQARARILEHLRKWIRPA